MIEVPKKKCCQKAVFDYIVDYNKKENERIQRKIEYHKTKIDKLFKEIMRGLR